MLFIIWIRELAAIRCKVNIMIVQRLVHVYCYMDHTNDRCHEQNLAKETLVIFNAIATVGDFYYFETV